jgi:hypothetical protein
MGSIEAEPIGLNKVDDYPMLFAVAAQIIGGVRFAGAVIVSQKMPQSILRS